MDKVLFPHLSFLMFTEAKHFITGIFDVRIRRMLFCRVISCSTKSCHEERGQSRGAAVTDMQKSVFLIN